MEVDYCEWHTDPRQRHGLIAHTNEHFVGCVYPSHQWADGLLAYYYLTGDKRARRAVVGCADNCVYWVENCIEQVCCDGREAGMPLVNLMAGYRLTRDARYVAAATTIIASFHQHWFDTHGAYRYPYPQGACQRIITGYGDWSTYAGLYRVWEETADDAVRTLLLAMLEAFVKPENFSLNDCRGMDFYAAWAYAQLSGDRRRVLDTLAAPARMLLRRGGHPLRRLHYLALMDEEGLIDDSEVGSRGGTI
jgi:rhamnogalacturonyl hydrolase YesR